MNKEDYIVLPQDATSKTKIEPKFIVLIIAIVIAGILAIVSSTLKTQSSNSPDATANLFFNYLISGRETSDALPEYKEDMSFFIETAITSSDKEFALKYINRAIELDEAFIKKTDTSKLSEISSDFITDQHDDLLFLKYYLEHPAPTLDDIVKTDSLSASEIKTKYNSLELGEGSYASPLPQSAKSYINDLNNLASTKANDYATDYEITIRYDLYEAAKKYERGCTHYNCKTKISNQGIDTELIDLSYNDFINAPAITATGIAASSFDIAGELQK